MSARPADPAAAKAHDARLRAEAEAIVHRTIGAAARQRARDRRGPTRGFPERSAKAAAARLSWQRRHVLGDFA